MKPNNHLVQVQQCLASRIEDFNFALKESTAEDETFIIDDILDIKQMRCIEVCLSWGGPSEWIRAIIDQDQIRTASFHYTHWFDHTEVKLSEQQTDIMVRWLDQHILPLLDACPGGCHE